MTGNHGFGGFLAVLVNKTSRMRRKRRVDKLCPLVKIIQTFIFLQMPLRICINQNCLNFYRLETDKRVKTRPTKFFLRSKNGVNVQHVCYTSSEVNLLEQGILFARFMVTRIKVLLPPGTSVSGCHAQKQEPASRHMALETTDETPCSLGVSNISFKKKSDISGICNVIFLDFNTKI